MCFEFSDGSVVFIKRGYTSILSVYPTPTRISSKHNPVIVAGCCCWWPPAQLRFFFSKFPVEWPPKCLTSANLGHFFMQIRPMKLNDWAAEQQEVTSLRDTRSEKSPKNAEEKHLNRQRHVLNAADALRGHFSRHEENAVNTTSKGGAFGITQKKQNSERILERKNNIYIYTHDYIYIFITMFTLYIQLDYI